MHNKSIITATLTTILSLLFTLLLKINSVEINGRIVASIVVSSYFAVNMLVSYSLNHGIFSSVKYLVAWTSIFTLGIVLYVFKWELDNGYRRVLGAIMPSYGWNDSMNKTLAISRGSDGHFYLSALVNNVKIRFMIDTGASDVALTQDDAISIGVDMSKLKFSREYSTANGIVSGSVLQIDTIKIGDKVFRDVQAHYSNGKLDISLLGMSVIEKFKSFKIDKDVLYLEY